MSRKKDIFREERLQIIIERLVHEKKIYVADLVKEFNISPSSIRMDLAELEERGLLQRTYGGAILPEQLNKHVVVGKTLLHTREESMQSEKEAIGRLAAEYIEDGDTLMMDGGSTVWFVARHLSNRKNLTIVTNGVNLLAPLMEIADSEVYVCGGLLRRRDEVLLGDISVEILGRFNTAKCFLGIDGISLQSGLTATDYPVAATKRKMIAASKQIIVVCDHSKLGQVCLVPVAAIEKMDVLITDSGANLDVLEAIRERGVKVVVAG